MEEKRTNRKRVGLLAALAMCCVLAVGAGVMAWFSAQDNVENVFTSGGNITDPEKEPSPTDPEKPGTEENTNGGKIEEDKWEPDSPITPGASVPKNPNVGIGSDSPAAYVFVEVENKVGVGTYFILNDNWMPVDDSITKYTGDKGWAAIHEGDTQTQAKAYSGGLFVYKKGAMGTSLPDAMTLLTPAGGQCVYTGEVFSKVFAGQTAVIEQTNPTMNVKAYLAAGGENEDITTSEAKAEILAAAKAWTTSNNNN